MQATHLLLSLTDIEDSPYDMDRLLSELNIDPDYSISSGLRCKSKWIPTLSGGNVIDNFYKRVLEDIDRINCNNTLNAFKYHDNLTQGERSALSVLSKNNLITIREADKGGNVVVMNRSDYEGEILSRLSDTTCYEQITKNPI